MQILILGYGSWLLSLNTGQNQEESMKLTMGPYLAMRKFSSGAICVKSIFFFPNWLSYWNADECGIKYYAVKLTCAISNFRYVLMCIHFLQQRRPAILPCLQVYIVVFNFFFSELDLSIDINCCVCCTWYT